MSEVILIPVEGCKRSKQIIQYLNNEEGIPFKKMTLLPSQVKSCSQNSTFWLRPELL
jgi:hypothetical protein